MKSTVDVHGLEGMKIGSPKMYHSRVLGEENRLLSDLTECPKFLCEMNVGDEIIFPMLSPCPVPYPSPVSEDRRDPYCRLSEGRETTQPSRDLG